MKLSIFFSVLSLSCLGLTCDAADRPEYLRYYDLAQGFKHAQANLTEIFLQIAGNLESTGSPEPYLRHMQEEHLRIAAKYKAATGHELVSHWPAYMTDGYVDQMIANWKLLSPKLRLDNLARDAGLCTRRAIRGSQGAGTLLVSIFNEHQKLVAAGMEGKGPVSGFEQLKAVLSTELEPDKPQAEQSLSSKVQREKSLTAEEQQEYARLLAHEHFTKAEFTALNHFYSSNYEKLTEAGKNEVSKRVWGGVRGSQANDTRPDAISAARAFLAQKSALFKALDDSLAQPKASELKEAINSAFLDIGQVAHAELELGILDEALH